MTHLLHWWPGPWPHWAPSAHSTGTQRELETSGRWPRRLHNLVTLIPEPQATPAITGALDLKSSSSFIGGLYGSAWPFIPWGSICVLATTALEGTGTCAHYVLQPVLSKFLPFDSFTREISCGGEGEWGVGEAKREDDARAHSQE